MNNDQQILIAFLAGAIAILTGLWAKNSKKLDRNLRNSPFLAFESSLRSLKLGKFSQALPGFDTQRLNDELGDLVPPQAYFFSLPVPPIDSKPGFGSLRNYGSGTALSVDICWCVDGAWVKQPTTTQRKKLRRKLYQPEFCTMSSEPNNILPYKSARILGLPSFILADYALEMVQVEGTLEIRSKNVFGKVYITKQKFKMIAHHPDNYSKELEVIIYGAAFSEKKSYLPRRLLRLANDRMKLLK